MCNETGCGGGCSRVPGVVRSIVAIANAISTRGSLCCCVLRHSEKSSCFGFVSITEEQAGFRKETNPSVFLLSLFSWYVPGSVCSPFPEMLLGAAFVPSFLPSSDGALQSHDKSTDGWTDRLGPKVARRGVSSTVLLPCRFLAPKRILSRLHPLAHFPPSVRPSVWWV